MHSFKRYFFSPLFS